MLKDYNEEQFAKYLYEFLKPSFDRNCNFYEWPLFFEEFPHLNLQILQQKCYKLGFHIEPASYFQNQNKYLKKLWTKNKSAIFFLSYENIFEIKSL